jgi:hypothetical protein
MATARAATRSGGSLYACDGFAPAFAAFLRHDRDWRRRRIDRFFPVDRDLATRTINLQGVIDAALVEEFLDRHGDDLGFEGDLPKDGDKLTVWIPAISQGKRLLLDYSIRDGQGKSLPMLNRLEAARAVAQDLLGILVAGMNSRDRAHFARAQTADSFLSIFVLLAALAFQYPFLVVQRVDEWLKKEKRAHPSDTLAGRNLKDWVRREAESFLSTRTGEERALFADTLVSELHALFHWRTGLEIRHEIPQQFRVGAMARFSSLPELLLHGVRDLLEVFVALSRPDAKDVDGRCLLSRDLLRKEPAEFARAAANRTLHGLGLLSAMLERQDEQTKCVAEHEVMSDLQRWTAYLVMEIQLGVPFQVKISETLVLDSPRPSRSLLSPLRHATSSVRRMPRILRSLQWPGWREAWRRTVWRLRFRTGVQLYPLALGDAEIYHVEVIADDPELDCARGEMAEECIGASDGTKEFKQCDLDDYFSAQQSASDRLLHLYSTRGSREQSATNSSAPEQAGNERTPFLRMRFPLTWSVRLGYTTAAAAFLVAGGYIASVWWEATKKGQGPQDLKVVATVSALAVTMSLWLMRVQHPRRIVQRKVRWAHVVFAIAILLIILSPVVFLTRWAISHPATGGSAPRKSQVSDASRTRARGARPLALPDLRLSAQPTRRLRSHPPARHPLRTR